MKRTILIFIAVFFTCCAYAQQESQFTQYIFNGIHINPAYAGYKESVYIQSFYRSQWQGVTGAPKSFSIAVDGANPEGNIGLGLSVSNDQIGAQSYLSAYGSYAYKVRLGYDENSRLSFGIAAGLMQLGLDGNKLQSIDQTDGSVAVSSQTRILPDVRFGVYYSNENFFAGFSATNMLARYAARKNMSSLTVPVPQPHFYFTAGALLPISDEIAVKPVIMLKDDVKGPTSLDLNGFVLLNERIWLGAFYRTSVGLYNKPDLQTNLPKSSAAGLIIEVFATSNLRIGYSYDYTLNKLQNYNSGSHEISAGIYLNRKSTRRDGQLKCYDF
ncbi:PorP/SprF family type IX secretion system membrane protein [Pedobacter frigoris]|uniref:Type IX secretion system membrane protein PorP/SprF n=1 Tax=Pedobacter frigoris TaxID=2571272 RepID=A0A4U1CNQ7_9SPHI|nr:type IX secretion system membrane protein PorP/SprF [Pedobacter frigoris]TKC09144.1 type IX secretion system membrane protein PorP/SprF [Pedobacter frigoris]